MTKVLSFGSYNFLDAGIDFSANFSELSPRTTRMPGMTGGYDEFGTEPAPGEIGIIRLSLWLIAETPADMQRQRDALRALASLGVQQLIVEPEPGVANRWAYCRVQNIQMSEPYRELPRLQQRVLMTWQASDPHWYSSSSDSGAVASCSGTATNFSRTQGGSGIALPVITVAATSDLAGGFIIRRLDGATVLDEIDYGAALVNTDSVVVDCRALSVKKNGVGDYNDDFSAAFPAWMRLLPGANALRVILGGGESANVTVSWDDTWY